MRSTESTTPGSLAERIPGFLSLHKAPITGRAFKIALLLAYAGGFLLAHYFTPVSAQTHVFHDIYRRAMYVPIILSAFWFGWFGGILSALLISVIYFPHIYHDWGGDPFFKNLDQTLEVVMYLVVGSVTGGLINLLRRKHRELERALENLTNKTREVFEAEEQLRRSDRLAALGKLTTGLAHEIRNPLASIRGAAEILGDPDIPAERRAEFSQIMIEETRRLDEVLENLLFYARSQKAEGHQTAQLKSVVDRLCLLLAKQVQASKITVEASLAGDLPPLAIGETLLQQVILNVMINAIQAMPDGGILAIHAARKPAEPNMRIAVMDTGSGVPRENIPYVFDPFFTTKNSGCGLGLSIAHKIVTSHKGEIYLDPSYSPGASFVIELPINSITS